MPGCCGLSFRIFKDRPLFYYGEWAVFLFWLNKGGKGNGTVNRKNVL
jgi:hypothetical protein